MRRWLVLSAASVLIAMISLLTGCGGSSSDPRPPVYPMTVTFAVTMTNASDADTHLFITGENFDAANKLTPGGRRTRTISFTFGNATETANIVVRAGRNGTVLTSHTIEVNSDSLTIYQVAFNGASIVTP